MKNKFWIFYTIAVSLVLFTGSVSASVLTIHDVERYLRGPNYDGSDGKIPTMGENISSENLEQVTFNMTVSNPNLNQTLWDNKDGTPGENKISSTISVNDTQTPSPKFMEAMFSSQWGSDKNFYLDYENWYRSQGKGGSSYPYDEKYVNFKHYGENYSDKVAMNPNSVEIATFVPDWEGVISNKKEFYNPMKWNLTEINNNKNLNWTTSEVNFTEGDEYQTVNPPDPYSEWRGNSTVVAFRNQSQSVYGFYAISFKDSRITVETVINDEADMQTFDSGESSMNFGNPMFGSDHAYMYRDWAKFGFNGITEEEGFTTENSTYGHVWTTFTFPRGYPTNMDKNLISFTINDSTDFYDWGAKYSVMPDAKYEWNSSTFSVSGKTGNVINSSIQKFAVRTNCPSFGNAGGCYKPINITGTDYTDGSTILKENITWYIHRLLDGEKTSAVFDDNGAELFYPPYLGPFYGSNGTSAARYWDYDLTMEASIPDVSAGTYTSSDEIETNYKIENFDSQIDVGNVNSCQDLNSADTVYSLISDINTTSSDCFRIKANNITLDCGGHYINGSDTGDQAVSIENNDSVVKNCVFKNWNEAGVIGVGSYGGTVRNIECYDSQKCIADVDDYYIKDVYSLDSKNLVLNSNNYIEDFHTVNSTQSGLMVRGDGNRIVNMTCDAPPFEEENNIWGVAIENGSNNRIENSSIYSSGIWSNDPYSISNLTVLNTDFYNGFGTIDFRGGSIFNLTDVYVTGGGVDVYNVDNVDVSNLESEGSIGFESVTDFYVDGVNVSDTFGLNNVTDSYLINSDFKNFNLNKLSNFTIKDSSSVAQSTGTMGNSTDVVLDNFDLEVTGPDWTCTGLNIQNCSGVVYKNSLIDKSPSDAVSVQGSGDITLLNLHVNDTFGGIGITDTNLNLTDIVLTNNNDNVGYTATSTSYCSPTFSNVTVDGEPVEFYNTTQSFDGLTGKAEMIFCDADGSSLNNMDVGAIDFCQMENSNITNSVLSLPRSDFDYSSSNLVDNVSIDGQFTFTYSSDNEIVGSDINSAYIYSSSTNNIFRQNEMGGFTFYGSGGNNNIYNNLINGSISWYFDDSDEIWNTTKQSGSRIYSDGNYIGGNYYTNSTGNGFSDTCSDSNNDGFCDSSYTIATGDTDYLAYSDEFNDDTISPTFSDWTQDPSDILSDTMGNLNITVKITDDSGVNSSSVKFWKALNDSDDPTFSLEDTQYDGDNYHDVWDDGTYVYTASRYDGIRAYSFNESGNEEFDLKDTQDNGGFYRGVWGDGDYIYTACGYDGVRAYSFDGSTFTLENTQGDGGQYYNVWGNGTYIYTACFGDGVRAYTFDENGTEDFWLKDTQYDGGQYHDVWSNSTYIYTACDADGVRAYTFDGNTFTLEDTQDDGGNYYGVWDDGTYVYTTCRYDGVRAYSFDGSNFTLEDTQDNGGEYFGVWSDSTYVYTTCYADGVYAYSFDGSSFTLKDTQDDGNYFGVWGDGTYIYTACKGDGIRAYTFEAPNQPWHFINGTAEPFWKSCSMNNTTDIYNKTTCTGAYKPATFNVRHTTMKEASKTNYSLDTNKEAVKIRFYNISTETNRIYNLNTKMWQNSGGVKIYYCNSSYSSGRVDKNDNCIQIKALTTENESIIYQNIPFSSDENAKIGNTKVTPTSYFVFLADGSTDWDLEYASIDSNSIVTSTDRGNNWASQDYSFNSRLFQVDGNGLHTINYKAEACDLASTPNCANSTTQKDTYATAQYAPTPPANIITPVKGTTVSGTININWTESEDPNDDAFNYTIMLYNGDETYNQTLGEFTDSSGTLSMIWDTTTVDSDDYYIYTNVTDSEDNTNQYIMPENFTIDNVPSVPVVEYITEPSISLVAGEMNNTQEVSCIYSDGDGYDNISYSDSYFDFTGLSDMGVVYFDDSSVGVSQINSTHGNASVLVDGIPYYRSPETYSVDCRVYDGIGEGELVGDVIVNSLLASDVNVSSVDFGSISPGGFSWSDYIKVENAGNIRLNSSWKGSNFTSGENSIWIANSFLEWSYKGNLTQQGLWGILQDFQKVEVQNSTGNLYRYYEPRFRLNVPSGTPAGSYSNTFTHSISQA